MDGVGDLELLLPLNYNNIIKKYILFGNLVYAIFANSIFVL